jgi:predicted Zn-dependent protease
MNGGPGVDGQAILPDSTGGAISVDLPGRDLRCGGFELAMDPTVVDYLLTGMDQAVRLRELPRRPFQDVGRFPVVFDGVSFASVMGMTVSQALDGDRVAGIEADASGGSFLVPPDEILGATTPQFSPLINAAVNRALPSSLAAQWDDEGVVPEPYTIIEHGHVVDYHTTRETAALMSEWYAKHGRPLRAHGSAIAPTPASLPAGSGAHVHVTPAANRATLDDLARDIQRGFIMIGGDASSEPGLTLTCMNSDLFVEVQRGKLVSRTNVTMQFPTKQMLKEKVVALGDAHTLRTARAWASKGVPWEGIPQLVTAPAALCKDIDVISWFYHP